MKDQLNRNVPVDSPPLRIVSVVPSQTELLYHLGLDKEVAGITKFCVHPRIWFKSKIRVGGTKKLDIAAIRSLLPDMIFANKEENTRADIETLETFCPVWISDISTFENALDMIRSVGIITGREANALEIVEQLQEEKSKYQAALAKRYPALYLVWNQPYMAAGNDTFIHTMMDIAGFDNICPAARYPELSNEDLLVLQPPLILLSSEPFPFQQKHVDELSALLPQTKIILVEGELFSWYGSRMLRSIEYFSALHAQLEKI